MANVQWDECHPRLWSSTVGHCQSPLYYTVAVTSAEITVSNQQWTVVMDHQSHWNVSEEEI